MNKRKIKDWIEGGSIHLDWRRQRGVRQKLWIMKRIRELEAKIERIKKGGEDEQTQ